MTFEDWEPVGPGVKRTRPIVSKMVAVRFDPEWIARVKVQAAKDGMSVSSWMRWKLRCAVLDAEATRWSGGGQTFNASHAPEFGKVAS